MKSVSHESLSGWSTTRNYDGKFNKDKNGIICTVKNKGPKKYDEPIDKR